jgi:diguanylate cyclase (GGDEF)-like protein
MTTARWRRAFAPLSRDALLPLTPTDRLRTHRLAAVIRSIAIAVLGLVLMWELRDRSTLVLAAAAIWMFPGIATNWLWYRRAGGVLAPNVWARDIVSFSVFAAIVPTYFVPATMGMLAILAFASYTVVRRTVVLLAVQSVVCTAIAALVVNERVDTLAALFFPFAVLAIVLPSQLLAPSMHRSMAFNESVADALDVAMFESVGIAGQPMTMTHVFTTERLGLGPSFTEAQWLEMLHPDDRAVSDEMDRAVDAGEDYHVRYRQRIPSGEYRWIEETGRVEKTGDHVRVFGMIRDVTKAVNAQEQLVRLDHLAESIDVVFSVVRLVDPDDARSLEVVWENAASRAIGRPRSVAGNRLADIGPMLFEDVGGRVIGELVAAVARDGVPARLDDVRIRYPDGFRVCSIVMTPITEHQCAIVMHDVTELSDARHALEDLAYVDQLTGLPNRTRLHEHLSAAPAGSLLMVLDLDRFTDVNEAFGHRCGDELIVEVARVLAEAPDGAVVGRLGGDEFAIVVPPGVCGRDEGVQRIFQAMTRPMQLHNGLVLQASISMGITTKARDDTPADEVFRQADVALTRAKEMRNTHVVYDPQSDTSAPHRMMLLGELRRALLNGEFELLHQPSVDTRTGTISSVEALLVWHHPSLGVIPADDLGEIVQLSNLHGEIVVHTLREAIHHWQVWDAAGHRVPVSINVDGRVLLDPALVERMAAVVQAAALPLNALGVEIDERQLSLGRDVSRASLQRLRAAGMWVTIDHLGSGRSPMSALRASGANAIKIDHRALSELLPANDVLLSALAAAVREFGLLIAAEGADDEAAYRWLVDHGADQVQGDYVAPLMSAEDLLLFVASHPSVPVAFR